MLLSFHEWDQKGFIRVIVDEDIAPELKETNMLKHTSGPWVYQIVPDDGQRGQPRSEWTGLFIGPESDEPPGTLSHTIFEGSFTHGPDDGDPEADARVMVAGPELLKALKAAQQVLATLINPKPNESTIHAFANCSEAEIKARKAIAKAEGTD